MDYNFDKRTVDLSVEGETIQTFLLSGKYPQLVVKVARPSTWQKFWSWLVG
jgi:hypothetical protein